MADEATNERIEALLRLGAERERRLLRRERRAEREVARLRAKLDEDETQLAAALRRVERRRAKVAAAEAELRRRQEARAAGPRSDEGLESGDAPGHADGAAAAEPVVAEGGGVYPGETGSA